MFLIIYRKYLHLVSKTVNSNKFNTRRLQGLCTVFDIKPSFDIRLSMDFRIEQTKIHCRWKINDKFCFDSFPVMNNLRCWLFILSEFPCYSRHTCLFINSSGVAPIPRNQLIVSRSVQWFIINVIQALKKENEVHEEEHKCKLL